MYSPYILAFFALIGCFIALAGVIVGHAFSLKKGDLKPKESENKKEVVLSDEEKRIVEVKRQEYLNFLNYNGDEMPDPEKMI